MIFFQNCSMVDYPSRPSLNLRDPKVHGPRCGAHRDFGTFTLIFPDGTSGLEVLVNEKKEIWRPIKVGNDSAVLLFGKIAFYSNTHTNKKVSMKYHMLD